SPGKQDRRQRLLQLTEKGRMLEERLTENQRQRIAAAFSAVDEKAVVGFRDVLLGVMTSNEDRNRFE
ncbi:MAG: MarR family transcriptional regulator, partial [Pseudomonadota bacterium]|nr:MarR family transcriptional regulator [Pseudomonadota bacterium]